MDLDTGDRPVHEETEEQGATSQLAQDDRYEHHPLQFTLSVTAPPKAIELHSTSVSINMVLKAGITSISVFTEIPSA